MTAGHTVRVPKSTPDNTGVVVSESSTLRASTTSVHHVLKIEGYSSTMKSFPVGKALLSESFRIGGGTSWHIEFYPNGQSSEDDGFASIHVVLDAAYLAVKAQIGFDVLDLATGEPMPRYTKARSEVYTCNLVSASWGYDDFIAKEELDKLLKNDCLSVRCNITVIEFLAEAAARPRRIAVPPPDWANHFGELLRSEQGADVRFRVGGETFAAHRCVLAARSPVFKAELYGAMKEGSADVHIDGMRAEVFRNLLQFAYTEELPPVIEEDAAAMAQHLLEAADRYGMERLKLVCEDMLCKHIDVSTAVTTLVLAEQHRCNGLKEACFEFILSSSTTLEEVMATDGFDHLTEICPDLWKELMSRLAASLDGWRRTRRWDEDDNHDLTLRTTEGDELPEPLHRVFTLGATKRMRLEAIDI